MIRWPNKPYASWPLAWRLLWTWGYVYWHWEWRPSRFLWHTPLFGFVWMRGSRCSNLDAYEWGWTLYLWPRHLTLPEGEQMYRREYGRGVILSSQSVKRAKRDGLDMRALGRIAWEHERCCTGKNQTYVPSKSCLTRAGVP